MLRDFGLAIFFTALVAMFWALAYRLPAFPALEELTPVETSVTSLRQNFVGGKSSHYYLEMEVRGLKTKFYINMQDRLGDNSSAYQRMVQTLRPGQNIRLWARVREPRPIEMFSFDFDPAPFVDHRLPTIDSNPFGLGNYQADERGDLQLMPAYEVVQMERGDERLISYERIKASAEKEQTFVRLAWYVVLAISVLVYGRLLLIGIAIVHAKFSDEH